MSRRLLDSLTLHLLKARLGSGPELPQWSAEQWAGFLLQQRFLWSERPGLVGLHCI
jgi:hypothetical protein